MKRKIRHIALILVAGLFLVSSTGIYLTIHYCSSEDITGLFFFAPLTGEPCDHHAHMHDETSCCGNPAGNNPGSETDKCCVNAKRDTFKCSVPDEMPECCSNTVLYIAVEDNFVKTDQPAIQISYNLLQSASGLDIMKAAGNSDDLSPAEYIDPPPLLSGRKLTFFNRILLL